MINKIRWFFIFFIIFLGIKTIDKVLPFVFLPKEETKNDVLILQHTKIYIIELPLYRMKIYDTPDFNFRRLNLETFWFLFCYPSTTTLLTVATKKNGDSVLLLYNLVKKEIIWEIPLQNKFSTSNISKLSLSPKGNYIVCGLKKGEDEDICELYVGEFFSKGNNIPNLKWINRISKIDGRFIKLFEGFSSIIGWSPDEKNVFIPVKIQGEYKIVGINIFSGEYRIITKGEGVAVSPSGKEIAVIIKKWEQNAIKIINLETFKTKIIEVTPLNYITSIAWSNSGEGIYCIGEIKNSRFWAVYYVSLNNLISYIVKKKLWLYWGGDSLFQIKNVDN